MRTGVGLCLLGLLGLISFVLRQVAADQLSVPVPCDDPSVEKVVSSAVRKFNKGMTTGHHLALFQIQKVSKSDSGSDLVYSLDFTTRRSDCEADSVKPWEDCDYLPTGDKEPIKCNATVQVSGAEIETQQVDCFLDAHVHPEKAPCLGCPEDISVESDDLKVPLSVSIANFNSISDSTHLFNLHTIDHATRQVVAGFRYKIRFDMRKTICSKAENKELHELCVPNEQDVEFSNCNSTVDTAPWRGEQPQAQIECEAGPLPPSPFSRGRRPPGWSPLRSMKTPPPPTSAVDSVTHPPPTPTTPIPTPKASEKKEKKEDSSEEDMKVDKLHCPSKPWKPFHPAPPSVNANAEGVTKPPAFSDTDLLG